MLYRNTQNTYYCIFHSFCYMFHEMLIHQIFTFSSISCFFLFDALYFLIFIFDPMIIHPLILLLYPLGLTSQRYNRLHKLCFLFIFNFFNFLRKVNSKIIILRITNYCNRSQISYGVLERASYSLLVERWVFYR